MNGKDLLIDTNILVYFFEGRDGARELLEEKNLYVSSITVIELLGYAGLSSEQENLIRSFLDLCIIVELDESIRERTIALRKQYSIKTPDAIIAATALELSIPLATADRGFSRIDRLTLVNF